MCDSRTAIVFVSEGSERVKTATLSFKLNYLLPPKLSKTNSGVTLIGPNIGLV